MEALFWILSLLIGYVYIGYPLLLRLAVRRRRQPVGPLRHTPPVTVVIAARDEGKRIGARVRNILAQDYPADRLRVLVVSDGSSDDTAARARAAGGERIRVIELARNRGKAAAINEAMTQVQTPLVVFTDARQTFEPSAIAHLMRAMADPGVGAVSGQLVLTGDGRPGEARGAGLYWQYELAIRAMESELGSVVGVTGAIYALRTELFEPLPEGLLLDDVLVPMRVARAGYRVALCRKARAFDQLSQSMGEEFRRKVRTLAGNFQLMAAAPWLNSPRRNPLFAQWLSHKVLRLVVPYALIGLLVTAFLADGLFYRLAGWLQVAAYTAAIGGFVSAATGHPSRLLNAAASFVMLNGAAVMGLTVFALGRTGQIWQRH